MIKIVVDSGCELTDEMRGSSDPVVRSVPLSMRVGDTHYTDDGSLDIDEYLKHVESSPQAPKTAAPSPEAYLEEYRGESSIFAITLSSKLSGSYNSATLAQKMYLEEIGFKFIHVFDSLSASVGETLIAMKIMEFYKDNMSNNEIVEKVNEFVSDLKTYFLLERFDTAVKNGRMNPYVAQIASLLSIKPICKGIEGRMEVLDKARGYKRAISKLISIIQKEGSDFEDKTLAISHVKCLDKALEIKAEIMKHIKFKDVIICDTSGLCSTYAERDGIILAF